MYNLCPNPLACYNDGVSISSGRGSAVTLLATTFSPSIMSTYEFLATVPDERAAAALFERTRWPDGVYCPRCTSTNVYEVKTRNPMSHHCRPCRAYFSVRTNSALAASHVTLRIWAHAIYLFHTSRKGISSHQLSRELGITQKTAWFLMHRIREGMGFTGELFDGEVEVDETYVGGRRGRKHANKRLLMKSPTDGKVIVFGVRERSTGRVWAHPIPNTERETLHNAVGGRVAHHSMVYSDGHTGYDDLYPYGHEAVIHSVGEYVRGQAHTNGIESFWALLKRGYMGVFHVMSPKHLHRYVNEFAYRQSVGKANNFDAITNTIRTLIGIRLTYDNLIDREPGEERGQAIHITPKEAFL